MGITLKEALTIGRLKEGKVVAGENGLDRIVNYVDIMEVPDIKNWLRGEELIFTTGYSFKDKPELQERLIEELAKHNAAGFAIKLNRFFDVIPEGIIKKANELNFPIIQLPPDIPYIELTHPLLKEILLRQNRERWMNERLKELLENRSNDINKLKNYLKQLNSYFNVETPLVLILASYDDTKILKKYIKLEGTPCNSNFISGDVNGKRIFIYATKSPDRWKKEVDDLFYDVPQKDGVVFIISNLIKKITILSSEFKQLNMAINILEQIPFLKQNKYYYSEIVHYIFLSSLCNMDVSNHYIEYVLNPFFLLKKEERDVLMTTLYAYVKNKGNLSQAAKSSFMHRNTFMYRLKKLTKILNSSLDSPEELFKYELALNIYMIKNGFKVEV